MRSESIGFNVSHSDYKVVQLPTIVVMTSELQPVEYSINTESMHSIGLSPAFATKMPTSYDLSALKDYTWGPSNFGYLPPGMQQNGAIISQVKAVNVLISDLFFRESINQHIATGSVDARYLAAIDDPVTARIMLALGNLTEHGGREEWSILIDTLGSALSLRVAQQLGAKLAAQDMRAGRIDRAVEYINDNLDKRITLDEMAGAAFLSRFHFARKFKRTHGVTPQEYVSRRRAENAVHLIRQGMTGLSMVAFACGFSSQAHMTRVVKAHTGQTPGQHQRASGGRVSLRE